MAVFGIDLGTTYSSISSIDETGRPVVTLSREGTDSIPSAVYFKSADTVVVGATAKDTAVLEPDLVIELIKRQIGSHLSLQLHGRSFTAEEVSALILRRLCADAELATGNPVTDAVVTVPAYFGINEREATRAAGEIAGLNVIDVLSEPVAAAIGHGVFDTDSDMTILVYDLGGGTFDTTVIRNVGGDIHEVCTDGDPQLGGIDFDERLAEYAAEVFTNEHPDVPHPFDNASTMQDLRARVEETKKRLSEVDRQDLRFVHAGRVTRVTCQREYFEEITRDLLDRTVEITCGVLAAAADRGVTHIDEVLLVGGSSRMPAVATRLTELFGRPPLLDDPELAVANGAARYAFEEHYRRLVAAGDLAQAHTVARRAGLTRPDEERIANRQIRTVAARGFGVRCYDDKSGQDHVVHLIHGNDPLPAEGSRTFYSGDEPGGRIGIEVLEQASRVASAALEHNRLIAGGTVTVPPGTPPGVPIEVTFRLTPSGQLTATATEQATGQRLDLDIHQGSFSPDQIATLRDALALIDVS